MRRNSVHTQILLVVHVWRKRVETVGDDEKHGVGEMLPSAEAVQDRNPAADRGRAELLPVPVRQGGAEAERRRVRPRHHLLPMPR